MDEIKSVFINIYWFGAASPAAETMTAPTRSMDIFRTRVGDDQLQGREDDNLLICAKLERILSPEAGDHITFSLFLLSSKFFFYISQVYLLGSENSFP